jgi:hypothetical protein
MALSNESLLRVCQAGGEQVEYVPVILPRHTPILYDGQRLDVWRRAMG